MKQLKMNLVCMALLFASTGARAGIPVIDAAGLVQDILQVLAWVQQSADEITKIANQVQQIKQLGDTYNNMTGSRALGTVMNTVGDNSVVPANVQAAWAGYNNSLQLINQVKSLGASGQTSISQRFAQIQALLGQINGASDQKGALEIQARVAAENALVLNDANRIALMKMQQEAEAQRIQDDEMKRRQAQILLTAETANPPVTFLLGQ
jgi:type IV secretion system protein VirB5